MYYDQDGKPMSLKEWLVAFAEPRHVGNTRGRFFWISTVWLGLDHNWSQEGPPLIFETMVFPTYGSGEVFMSRYPSRSSAKVGHDLIVKEWTGWRGFWHYVTLRSQMMADHQRHVSFMRELRTNPEKVFREIFGLPKEKENGR